MAAPVAELPAAHWKAHVRHASDRLRLQQPALILVVQEVRMGRAEVRRVRPAEEPEAVTPIIDHETMELIPRDIELELSVNGNTYLLL